MLETNSKRLQTFLQVLRSVDDHYKVAQIRKADFVFTQISVETYNSDFLKENQRKYILFP